MNDESNEVQPESPESEAEPAGDPAADGPALADANKVEAETEAVDGTVSEPEEVDSTGAEEEPEIRPKTPIKLERLQKILAQAGVASRRRAEELIEQGRVQVNGKIVTELGTKADGGRDHIRVDGKLLQGAERLRYFVLNKPRGFVTTVKDPEGRPTVMQFFEKMRERLYPVGRLDYQSEGLLLVTNDGELANRLTKASSGVEKTYLVKVSGQPTEAELDILRGGVAIERGKPGSAQVRTAPARIRQVRQGDNPWYEVVLIEGRNRELRKMFEEIGHFVEKIRRVGYGPLVLDQEPGNLRELEAEEVDALRKAAEGKLRTPKSKDIRRRNLADAGKLPTVAPKPSRPRPAQALPPGKPVSERPGGDRAASPPREFRATRPASAGRPPYPQRSAGGRGAGRGPAPSGERPQRPSAGPGKFGSGRPAGRPAASGDWNRQDRPARSAGGSSSEGRAGRPFPAKAAWKKPEGGARPAYKRPSAPAEREEFNRAKPSGLHIEPAGEGDRGGERREGGGRAGSGGAGSVRPGAGRPGSGRPSAGRSGGSASSRPFRGEGGLARPFTTSSGKPRAGGARPSSKPGKPYKPAGRPFGAKPGGRTGPDTRPSAGPKPSFEGGDSGRSRPGGTGWKPKPNFGGKPRTGSGGASRPPSKSGPRGSGGSKTGPRPGGKRPGPPRGKRP
jgi:23S rRNA pseudouridine2605 synthase